MGTVIQDPFLLDNIVSDPGYGDGYVTNTNFSDKHPILVQFRNISISYTNEGREYYDRRPTLQHGFMDNWERRLTRSKEQTSLPEIEGISLSDKLDRMSRLVDRMNEVLDRSKGNKASTE